MSIRKLASAITIMAAISAVSFAAAEPVEISTPKELDEIRNNLSGNYVLMRDIALNSNELFNPIGNLSNPFTGTIDGKGYRISGLAVNRIDSAGGWAVGLFGVIGEKGKVRNVGVDGNVNGFYAGGLIAGINNGLIEGCYSTGSVSVNRTKESSAGGLAGINTGTISKSYSAANVVRDRNQNAGGLVGFLTDGVISNSFARGDVMGVRNSGGLVGYVFGGKINDSYAANKVEIVSRGSAGGLIGSDFGYTASWRVQGQNTGGNYVGKASVEDSFWDEGVSGLKTSAGGKGLSTADMKKIDTYLKWDTNDIWEVGADGYLQFIRPKTILVYEAGSNGYLRIGGRADSVKTFRDTIESKMALHGRLIAAVPDSGYRFAGWSGGGGRGLVRFDIGADNKDSTVRFTASFEKITAEPIEISNIDDLNKIGKDSDFPLHGNYVLTNVIDGYDYGNFTPIGTPDDPFTGTLRGKGEETIIYGLSIKQAERNNVGLFGYTLGAVITGVALQVDAAGRDNVGTLVGRSESTIIDNCAAIGGGALSGGGEGAGGLIGNSSASLIIRSFSSSWSSGAKSGAGGLVGVSTASLITHSYSIFTANAESAVGGLVGKNSSGMVQFCYSSGGVEGSSNTGGLIGEISDGGRAFQSYSFGQVRGSGSDIGGFAGAAEAGAVTACYWDIESSGRNTSAAGGIGRLTSDMKIKSTYAGWNWDVWDIDAEKSYPYIASVKPEDLPGLNKFRTQTSSIARSRPFAMINGRTLTINAPNPSANLQVNLIDMRGKTIARYNTKGSARISLSKVPSGRYIVEAREKGKRVNISKIIVR